MASTCAQLEVALTKLEAKLSGGIPTYNYVTQPQLAQLGNDIDTELGYIKFLLIPLVGAVSAIKYIVDNVPKELAAVTNQIGKEVNKVAGQLNQKLESNLEARITKLEARLKATEDLVVIVKNDATTALNEAYDVRKVANFAIQEANKANLEAKSLTASVNKIVADLNKQGTELKKREADLNKAVSKFNTDSKKVTAEIKKLENNTTNSFKYVVTYLNDVTKALEKEYQRVNNLVTQANVAKLEASKATVKANQAIADTNANKISIGKIQTDLSVVAKSATTAVTTSVNLQNNLPTIIGAYIKSTPTLIPISISQANQNIKNQFDQIKTDIQNQFTAVQTDIQNKLSTPQKAFEAAQKSINDVFKTKLDLNTQFNDTLKAGQIQLQNQINTNEQVNQQAIPILNQIAAGVAAIPQTVIPELQAIPSATVGALFPPLAAGQQQILQAVNSKPTAQQNAQAILPEVQAVPAATVGALYPPLANQLSNIQNKSFTGPTVAEIAAGILPEVQAVPAATVGALYPPIANQLTQIQAQVANPSTNTKLDSIDKKIGIVTQVVDATKIVSDSIDSTVKNVVTGVNNAIGGINSLVGQINGLINQLDGLITKLNNFIVQVNDFLKDILSHVVKILAIVLLLQAALAVVGVSTAATLATTTAMATRLGLLVKSLVIDRVLNLINFAANVHNAAMLTTSLKDTLLATLSTVGNATGLLQDADGDSIDLNKVFNQGIEKFMVLIMGQTNYTTLELYLKKYNKIYRSGANVINSVQSMMSSIGSVVETSAEYTGRIGNALMAAGAVGEKAYAWMAEKQNARISKFLKYGTTVAGVTVALSAIQEIAEEVIEGQEAKDQAVKDVAAYKKELKEAARDPGISNDEVEKAIAAKKAASAATPAGDPDEGLFSFLTE